MRKNWSNHFSITLVPLHQSNLLQQNPPPILLTNKNEKKKPTQIQPFNRVKSQLINGRLHTRYNFYVCAMPQNAYGTLSLFGKRQQFECSLLPVPRGVSIFILKFTLCLLKFFIIVFCTARSRMEIRCQKIVYRLWLLLVSTTAARYLL